MFIHLSQISDKEAARQETILLYWEHVFCYHNALQPPKKQVPVKELASRARAYAKLLLPDELYIESFPYYAITAERDWQRTLALDLPWFRRFEIFHDRIMHPPETVRKSVMKEKP